MDEPPPLGGWLPAARSPAAPVLRRLNMTVTAADSYLNNPSAGFRKNSFQFVTGVSYSLR